VTWRVENWGVAVKDTSPGTSEDRQTVVEGSVARRRVLLERESVVVVNAFVRVVVVVVVAVAACFAIELCWTYVVVVAVAAVVQVLRVVWGSRLCWMKTAAAAEMNLVFFVVAVAAVVVVVVDIDGMKTCRAAFETDSISTLMRARTTSGNPPLPPTSVLGWRNVVAAAGKEPDPGWQGSPSSAAGTWPRGLT
jgi:hypothetical protein